MSKTLQAHLALLISMIIYAASFTIAKLVAPVYLPAFTFVLLRVIGATALLWITDALFIRERIDRKDLPKLFLLAIFGVAVNQSLFIKGLSLTSPISAAIMMITSPLLVLVIGAVVLRERITLTKTTGLLLGFGGGLLLILSSANTSGREDNPLGDLMVFINALSWGMYLVLVKPLMSKYHTVTILRWIFLLGLPMVMPLGIYYWGDAKWDRMNSEIWFYALFVIIGTTFIAYLLNTYALKALSPSVVSAYIYLQPFLAAFIAVVWAGDHISLHKILAAAMIFTGVFLAGWKPRRSS